MKKLTLLLFISFNLNSKIIETNSLVKLNIQNLINTDNPLILFDIHNTLIKYDKNYQNAQDCIQNCIKDEDFQLKWFYIKPIEPKALDIIRQLQKKYKVLIITRCRNLLTYYKFYHLKKLNLDFSQAFANIPFYYIKKGKYPALYDKGIICKGDVNTKGEILRLFLKQNNIKPTQIILIDNKKENLETVEKTANKLGIPFIGIWYTRIQNDLY